MTYYGTEAGGTTYMEGRLESTAWDTATSANRIKALTQATRAIDRLNYRGVRTSTTQTNQFPRDDDTEAPDDIIYATYELAYWLLDGGDPELEYENLNIRNFGFSNVRANIDNSVPPEHVIAGIPSVTAWRYLRPYLRDPYNIKLTRVD